MNKELSPLKRLKRTIEGKEVDRIPVIAVTKMFGIKQINSNVLECVKGDPDVYVKSQWHCVSQLSHEALWNYSGIFPINEVLDPSSVKVTQDDLFVERRYLSSIEDVRSLPEENILDQGMIPRLIDTIKALKELSAGKLPVFGWISLPFEAAWMLRGHDIYIDLIEAPELVHELLDYCLNLHIQYAFKMVQAGADVIWTTNPVVNTECISRRHFEAFSFPVDKKFFLTLKQAGIRSMFHACGDWSDRVDMVFDLGADIYYLSRSFDLAEVKRKYGGICVIAGNVPAVGVLFQGTPEDVERNARACIAQAGHEGRFMLSPDCTVPRDTPPENLAALFRVAREPIT